MVLISHINSVSGQTSSLADDTVTSVASLPGWDKRGLEQTLERFLFINDERLTRACSRLSEKQQQFILVLPLLFHVNHPQFPGYINGSVPAGISRYHPNRDVQRLAKIFAKSFTLSREIVPAKPAIDALFAMGSVGSVAQNIQSDFDLWLCHNPEIMPDARALLERKATAIGEWAAKQLHLEVHIFLMSSEDFRCGTVGNLTVEGSGSAQHYLLLDEFYRSSIWLAGKVPLWWFIPPEEEERYDAFAAHLTQKRFIDPASVIDFGGIAEIPAEEFIGAGCWQLFKAIESPYKSLLKLLLIEVYAARLLQQETLPATIWEPLALTFKRKVYAQADVNAVDPYVLLYQKIANYLQETEQNSTAHTESRLDIVRRCFYIKINRPFDMKTVDSQQWQHSLLQSLMSDWSWSVGAFRHLDARHYWKTEDVIVENNRLVSELNRSYRVLSAIGRQVQVQALISLDELAILARKLHTAFERKAGKIELINPSISRDLGEPLLTLCVDKTDAGEMWSLFCGADTQHKLPVRRARGMVELLLFAKMNGLLVSGTHIEICHSENTGTKFQLQQLLQVLGLWLIELSAVNHRAFTQVNVTKELLIVINANHEPHAELHKKGLQRLSNINDPLGFSGFRENLVGQVDIVQHSSWGEISVRHFSVDALQQSLLYFLRSIVNKHLHEQPTLNVHCFSLGQGAAIAARLKELWSRLTKTFAKGSALKDARYCVEVGDEFWLIQIVQNQPQITRFNHYEKLIEKLAQPQSDYSAIIVDPQASRLTLLAAITKVTRKGDIQIFYHRHDSTLRPSTAVVYVIDENGSLIRVFADVKNQPVFLRPLFGFIRNTLQYQQAFNQHPITCRMEPASIFEITVVPSVSIAQRPIIQVARKALDKALLAEPYIHIKAVAEVTEHGEVVYSIYCNQKEFSALTCGEDLFLQLATYVVSQRPSGEPYPCYITDVDLSSCREWVSQQAELQLSHYLKIKIMLEQKINSALLQSIDNTKNN